MYFWHVLMLISADSWKEQYATVGVSGAVTHSQESSWCSGLGGRQQVVSVPSAGITKNTTLH